LIRAAAGIFRQVARSPGTPDETCTAGLSPPALWGRWPKPAPPDFPRPLSGDAGRNLHRRTFPARSPGTMAKNCTAGLSPPALRGRWPKPALFGFGGKRKGVKGEAL